MPAVQTDLFRLQQKGIAADERRAVRVPGNHFQPPFDLIVSRLDENLLGCVFRSVDACRLPVVLRNGIDVEPTESIFFANDFDKAREYGEFPKLILALEWGTLTRTFVEVPATFPSEELEALRRRFPTVVKRPDGTLWLSRLPENDPRIGTSYEWEHAWWIAGDPFKVLRSLFLFVRPEDQPSLLTAIEEALPR